MQVKHPKVHAKLVLLGNIRLQATSWRALPGVAATLDHTGMAQAQPPKVPVRHALNAIKAKFNSEVAAGPQTQSSALLAPTLSVHQPNTVLVPAAIPAADLNAMHATTCNALVTSNTGQVAAAVQAIQLPTPTNAIRTSHALKIPNTYHPIPRTESVQRVPLASINRRHHTGNGTAST